MGVSYRNRTVKLICLYSIEAVTSHNFLLFYTIYCAPVRVVTTSLVYWWLTESPWWLFCPKVLVVRWQRPTNIILSVMSLVWVVSALISARYTRTLTAIVEFIWPFTVKGCGNAINIVFVPWDLVTIESVLFTWDCKCKWMKLHADRKQKQL